MEINKAEIGALQEKSLEAEQVAVQELNDYQLTLAGGGNALVIVG